MDKGPFRVQQPESTKRQSGRVVTHRGDASSAEDASLGVRSAARSYSQPAATQKKKPIKLIIILILAGILLSVGWYVLIGRTSSLASTIDSKKYQAVFFSNGQVYFGKLKTLNKDNFKLTDIFYLQSQDSEEQADELQAGASQEGELQLIKLGNEVHGPEDQMIINRDQVLFYENLKPDSKVATSIKSYQSKN